MVNSEMTKRLIPFLKRLIKTALVFPILLLALSMYLMSWLGDAAEIAVLWIEDVDTWRGVILSIILWVVLIIILFTLHASLFTRF
jgi:hypothetical protein